MRKVITVLYFVLSLIALSSHPTVMAASAVEKATNSAQQTTVININKADAETIAASVKGVGLKKAKAIVAFREANGPFKALEEIALVKGIGMKTIKSNEGVIKLK